MAHPLTSLDIWPASHSASSASRTVYPDEQQPQLHPAGKQSIEKRTLVASVQEVMANNEKRMPEANSSPKEDLMTVHLRQSVELFSCQYSTA